MINSLRLTVSESIFVFYSSSALPRTTGKLINIEIEKAVKVLDANKRQQPLKYIFARLGFSGDVM